MTTPMTTGTVTTKPDIAIIVPFYNEKNSLPRLTQELGEHVATMAGLSVQVIFVDDGSQDGSSEALKTAKHASYRARLLRLSRNFGVQAALRAGITHSEARFTTSLYADLQDPPELVSRLYARCAAGYDIVWAERRTSEIGLLDGIFSRMYAWLMQRFAIPTYPNKNFDIMMFNERVKDELNQNIEANSSIFLQILDLGFRQASISYDKKGRKGGRSKWTLAKKIKMLIDSFVAFSYAPIRFVSVVGFAMALMGFAWAGYIVTRALLFNDLAQGWASLVSFLMIGFGVTNISLGIIAEYLWRTLDASRSRKCFVVSELAEL